MGLSVFSGLQNQGGIVYWVYNYCWLYGGVYYGECGVNGDTRLGFSFICWVFNTSIMGRKYLILKSLQVIIVEKIPKRRDKEVVIFPAIKANKDILIKEIDNIINKYVKDR
jgi:hypothetical protein